MLKSYSQAIHDDLDLFKINFIRFFKNFTSLLSITSAGSVSSALKDVFINNQIQIMIIMVRFSLDE